MIVCTLALSMMSGRNPQLRKVHGNDADDDDDGVKDTDSDERSEKDNKDKDDKDDDDDDDDDDKKKDHNDEKKPLDDGQDKPGEDDEDEEDGLPRCLNFDFFRAGCLWVGHTARKTNMEPKHGGLKCDGNVPFPFSGLFPGCIVAC